MFCILPAHKFMEYKCLSFSMCRSSLVTPCTFVILFHTNICERQRACVCAAILPTDYLCSTLLFFGKMLVECAGDRALGTNSERTPSSRIRKRSKQSMCVSVCLWSRARSCRLSVNCCRTFCMLIHFAIYAIKRTEHLPSDWK